VLHIRFTPDASQAQHDTCMSGTAQTEPLPDR
jgi:hypothetical protein